MFQRLLIHVCFGILPLDANEVDGIGCRKACITGEMHGNLWQNDINIYNSAESGNMLQK